MDQIDLLVTGGEVWTPGGFVTADVAVAGRKVAGVAQPGTFSQAQKTIDATGKKVIPGTPIRTIATRDSRIKRI